MDEGRGMFDENFWHATFYEEGRMSYRRGLGMGIEWKEELATGIESIDSHHRELFSRLNTFLDASDAGRGKEELVSMLQFLNDYVAFHFQAEERLHREYEYRDRVRHREEHRLFIERLIGLKRRFLVEGPTAELVREINRFTVGWLLEHIAERDQEFGLAVRGASGKLHPKK